ncbi:MAG: hypothetical protein GXP16_17290 [Gammaproteobacteria bacterium]|nr:hypothetical protein [Gammaproteobacteria bacterium]
MNSITQQVLAHVTHQPEGTTVSARELLHLGGRDSIDQALSRLLRRGQLLRVGRGLYTCPIETRFGRRPPSAERVVQDIAERTGETVVPSGAVAANQLGLTTQNPMHRVYWTSGKSRTLPIGAQRVSFEHKPPWQLSAPHSTVGQALRALSWLGEATASVSMAALQAQLSTEEQRTLARLGARGPSWLAKTVAPLAAHG